MCEVVVAGSCIGKREVAREADLRLGTCSSFGKRLSRRLQINFQGAVARQWPPVESRKRLTGRQ